MRRLSTLSRLEVKCLSVQPRVAAEVSCLRANEMGVPYHGERSVFGVVLGWANGWPNRQCRNDRAELPLRDAYSISRATCFGSEWCQRVRDRRRQNLARTLSALP